MSKGPLFFVGGLFAVRSVAEGPLLLDRVPLPWRVCRASIEIFLVNLLVVTVLCKDELAPDITWSALLHQVCRRWKAYCGATASCWTAMAAMAACQSCQRMLGEIKGTVKLCRAIDAILCVLRGSHWKVTSMANVPEGESPHARAI